MVVQIPVTHTFAIYSEGDNVSSITPRLARAIENTVNQITKTHTVVQLDQFEDYFLVRMGSHTATLEKEHHDEVVGHIVHVTLRCVDDPSKKKLIFGIWKRLKSSKVLV